MSRPVLRGIIVGLAAVGVVGQAIILLVLVAVGLSVLGFATPLASIRRRIRGAELWMAFAVAAFSTAGSLFFSEAAHFPPCEICWYERFCMYPLSVLLLIAAARRSARGARWLLPAPILGAGLSVYHVLIENGLAPQFTRCLQSLPAGCGLKWIDEFGFVTIPMMALTAFALLIVLMAFAARLDAA